MMNALRMRTGVPKAARSRDDAKRVSIQREIGRGEGICQLYVHSDQTPHATVGNPRRAAACGPAVNFREPVSADRMWTLRMQ